MRTIATNSSEEFADALGKAMKVTKVKTVRMLVNSNTGKMDKCTWIHCACRVHGAQGWRKFYWTTEDGTRTTEDGPGRRQDKRGLMRKYE